MNAAAILERLVGFDTTSALSNLALIEWVQAYLAGHGVAATAVPSDDGRKANLFATIGPTDRGGVVLSGHTDVVPVAGQAWSTDPFRLTQKDGRLYGRGSADMKGFIAAALAAVPAFTRRTLTTPIHFAFSYDEETGCFGVPRLIEAMSRSTHRPRLVIVGEPTMMRIVTGHKGCAVFETEVVGLEAHSSATHRGVSAIAAAAEIVLFIERLGEEKRLAADPASPYVPPHTTFNIGTIDGGTAQNIVPNHCKLVWQYRLLPGDDGAAIEARVRAFCEDDLLPRLRARHAGARVDTTPLAGIPPFDGGTDNDAETLVRRLTGLNAPAGVVSYGSEAGLFQDSGYPTVIFGPGSIDVAHAPDEFLELEQLAACDRFMAALAAWASA